MTDDEPRRLRVFHAEDAEGRRTPLFLCGWKEGRAHLTSNGAASYLADPKTGWCEGIESSLGSNVQLCYSSLRRLRLIAGTRVR